MSRLAWFRGQNKLLEEQRLRMRTTFDLEMLKEIGSCSGVENYSRHIDGRGPGTPPHTLLDYFPDDFLLIIDESHVTVPQIGAMFEGDMSRKRTLVDYGFRLPSAMDNRPLKWDEFTQRIGHDRLPVRDAGSLRARALGRRGRADYSPDRPCRSARRRQAHRGADRRSS